MLINPVYAIADRNPPEEQSEEDAVFDQSEMLFLPCTEIG